ncbi:hypothetical protein I552_10238 [Mycobacterium xenopi 3993]|nr:hypothetical protein I552_10238 [Mycobacterium xenopi 3993]
MVCANLSASWSVTPRMPASLASVSSSGSRWRLCGFRSHHSTPASSSGGGGNCSPATAG